MLKILGGIVVAAASLLGASGELRAGEVALKSNALYDLTGTLNLGVEFPVAPQWTIDVSMNLNAWKYGEKSLRHTLIQPEGRYWMGLRNTGHFFSGSALVGYYDIGNFKWPFGNMGHDFKNLRDFTYRGWIYGLGVGYGYSWMIADNWNFELELAIGYAHASYDRYSVVGHKYDGHVSKNYFGPIKAAATFSYFF